MSGTTTSLNIYAINLWFLWKHIAATPFTVIYSSRDITCRPSLHSFHCSPSLLNPLLSSLSLSLPSLPILLLIS